MKLLVVGSRSIKSYEVVKQVIESAPFKDIELLIHGGAQGVDRLAGQWAKENNIPTKVFIPDWNRLGKSAGYVRNQEMVDYLSPEDGIIIIHDGESKGSLHTKEIAEKKGVKVHYVGIRKAKYNFTIDFLKSLLKQLNGKNMVTGELFQQLAEAFLKEKLEYAQVVQDTKLMYIALKDIKWWQQKMYTANLEHKITYKGNANYDLVTKALNSPTSKYLDKLNNEN